MTMPADKNYIFYSESVLIKSQTSTFGREVRGKQRPIHLTKRLCNCNCQSFVIVEAL